MLEKTGDCIAIAVITDAVRTLLYYAHDGETVRPKLDQLRTEFSYIRTVYVLEFDPKWDVFRQLCGRRRPR